MTSIAQLLSQPTSRHLPNLRASFLLVLFVAYLFMGLLVVEQGRTIASQKALIRDLFNDSAELTSLKLQDARRQGQSQGQSQGQR